jgi:hypothetical protein
MKKLFTLGCLAGALLIPAHGATISFQPGGGTVSGPFTVDVLVANVFDGRTSDDVLFSYGFNVAFSVPGVLSLAGVASGPDFDAASSLGDADVFAAASGLGVFPGVSEPLLLATLTFDVVGSGPVIVSITTDPASLFQGLQYLEEPFQEAIDGNLTFDVTTQAVPEPSTFAALALALTALAASRFVRR